MGFFDRLAFGWRLGTTSLGVVMKDKTLMLFPILSGLASVAFVAAVVVGIGPEHLRAAAQEARAADQVPPMFYVLAFAAYLGLSFIAVYFNVALLGAAQQSIAGKDTTLGDGLAVANAHLGKVFGWAMISATVGVLLSMLESNRKIGSIVKAILGVAWAVITYFVVPIMIFEDKAPTGAIGRSVELMKKSWGENAGAQVGIGLVVVLLSVGLVGVGIAGVAVYPPSVAVLLPVVVAGTLVLALLGMAAKAVLAVALYEFASGTGGGGAFKPEELKAAFR